MRYLRSATRLTLALGLLSGCGSRSRAAEAAPGDVCQTSEQCPIDYACAGCPGEEAHCISGCSTDEDCSEGQCQQVACLTCPCPGICET